MRDDFNGLSSRAKNGLRVNGYCSAEQVVNAYVSGVRFDRIPNVGKLTAKEITEWAASNSSLAASSLALDAQIAVLEAILKDLKHKRNCL